MRTGCDLEEIPTYQLKKNLKKGTKLIQTPIWKCAKNLGVEIKEGKLCNGIKGIMNHVMDFKLSQEIILVKLMVFLVVIVQLLSHI